MVVLIIFLIFVIIVSIVVYVHYKAHYDSPSQTTLWNELKEANDILNQMSDIFTQVQNLDLKQLNKEELLAYEDLSNNTFDILRQHPGYKTVSGILAYRYILNWMRERVFEMDPVHRADRRNVRINDILN